MDHLKKLSVLEFVCVFATKNIKVSICVYHSNLGVDCLEVVWQSTSRDLYGYVLFLPVSHQLLTQGAAFWILIGWSLLIRDRELVSSDISMGQVGVFSGGLEAGSVFLRMRLEVDLY
jgi:hypothetical protein